MQGKCKQFEPGCLGGGYLTALRFASGSMIFMCHACKMRRLQKYPSLQKYQGRKTPVATDTTKNESGL